MNTSESSGIIVQKRIVSAVIILAGALACTFPAAASTAGRDPAWAQVGRAKRTIAEGNIGLALKQLHDVLRIETNNADAHYLLGELYRGEKKFDAAIVHYNAVIKYASTLSVPSKEIDARFSILLCYTNSDMVIRDRAVTNILRFAETKRDPTVSWRLHYFLGDYYEKLGNEVRAMYHYTNADAIAWLNADRIKHYSRDAAQERAGERAEHARIAATELPSQRMLMYRISKLYNRAKDFNNEKRCLMRASDYEFAEGTKETAKIDQYIAERLNVLKQLPPPKGERSK
ncbi:MAG: hypothetical protein AABZ39_17665 [Spirochaetota bacterium]